MRNSHLVNMFLAVVAFSSIALATSLDAGLVGLGLFYAMDMANIFQFGIRLSTEVENTVSEGTKS